MADLFPSPPQCLWCQQALHVLAVPTVCGFGECAACRTTPANLPQRRRWHAGKVAAPAFRQALATAPDPEIMRRYTVSRPTVQRYRKAWGIRYRKHAAAPHKQTCGT